VSRFLFPRWSNAVPTVVAGGLALVASTAGAGVWYYGTAKYLEVGYTPKQPVEFSHKLHAGELGLDCRYCHSTVERSSFSAVPATQTCMNCHTKVKADSPLLLPVQESWAQDKPIPWVRVHNLPDYVYFDHSAHLGAGVECASCHGKVEQMPRVTQKMPLTMAWCLDCHRNPAPALKTATADGKPVTATGRVAAPPVHCSGCHR
jgi:hypothetical protein